MNKDNVIQFPITPRVQRMQADIEEKYYEAMVDQDNAVQMAHYVFDLMTVGIAEQDWVPEYRDMEFKNPDAYEAKDVFVILNLISSMLLRYKGYSHMMQYDLDELYDKLCDASQGEHLHFDDEEEYDDFD